MNELEMKRALNRVKKAVAEKNYSQAKAILRRIEHPKTAQWLTQIEAAEKQYLEEKRPKPWNPGMISIVSITGSPILGAFVYAWNWRRFGKGTWGIWTLVIQLLLLALALGAAFFFFTDTQTGNDDPLRNTLVIYPLMLLFGLNYAFSFLVGSRQAAAYKLLQEKGYEAMLTFDYRWGRSTLFYIGGVFLIISAMTAYFYYDRLPKTFEDEHIALTYSGSWSSNSMRDFAQCEDAAVTCNLYLRRGNYGSEIFFQTWSTDFNISNSAEIGNWIWENNIRGSEQFTPSSHGDYVINGLEAHYLSYSNQDGFYYHDLIIAAGTSYVYITIVDTSKDGLDENWDEIEGILNSLVIK